MRARILTTLGLEASLLTMGAVILLALGALAQTVGFRGDEVVEHFADGQVKTSYAVDAEGRKHGPYLAYWENGRIRVKARYREDLLEGSYESFYEDGSRHVQASYRHDQLNGKYVERWLGGKPHVAGRYKIGQRHGAFELETQEGRKSRQKWKDGQLLELNDIEPFPLELEQMYETLKRIYDPETEWQRSRRPSKKKAHPAAVQLDEERSLELEVQRDAALRRLMAYRYLSGLAWDDLELDESYNAHCLAAAFLLERIGRLDHTPENPGLPEDEYRFAYTGTSSSNLAIGSSLRSSIDGYMDDSDPSNIERIGHRRACLKPSLRKTGFGVQGRFSAMWSFDTSRSRVQDWEAIYYPPRGYLPVDYLGERHAWSVWLNPNHFNRAEAGDLRILVERLDAEYLPTGELLELDYLGVNRGTIIFRPVGVEVSPGARYRVRIEGVSGHKGVDQLEYVVELVESDGSEGA